MWIRGVVIAVLLVGAGCGDDDTASPAERAEEYATERSGGETTGCSQAEPGEEAEQHPGCIYAAAFTGCHDGITGEQLSPIAVEDEFAQEPALQALYFEAVEDCSD
jgi:hypothetical protein